MQLILDDRDSYFESLANLQNRATWLIFIAILVVIVLGITLGHMQLFILGAVGGLLARMRSVVSSKEHAFDYGASWTILFLSPLVGALTGWAGVLLVSALLHLDLLGPFFNNIFNVGDHNDISWEDIEITKEAMALAIVFGFSATFFEKIISATESKLGKGNASKQADK